MSTVSASTPSGPVVPLLPAGLVLRRYEATDQAALVQLWQACALTRPWNDPARDIARKLTQQPEGLVVLQGPDGALAGSVMVGYDGHRGWINYLAVAPAHQRQGLGRVLMDWARAWLLAQGCPKINLQIRHDNLAAIGFYQALGYTEDAVLSFGQRLIDDGPRA